MIIIKRFISLLLACFCLAGSVFAAGNSFEEQILALSQTQEEQLQAQAEKILASILTQDMSDGEKALVIHDWIVMNCHYGYKPYRDMAYGGIINNEVLCRGYARTFVYLANLAGLPAVYTSSAELDHAWALVELDGSYYYADPTWDDDHYERIGFVNHRHFLFSSESAAELNHYGQDVSQLCAGGEYEDAPWSDAATRVVFNGNYAYYITHSMELCRYDRTSKESEVLLAIDSVWPDFYNDDGSVGVATGLVLLNNRLWFNTSSALCSTNLYGGDYKTQWTYDLEPGQMLCGVAVIENTLQVSVASCHKDDNYFLVDTGIQASTAWGLVRENRFVSFFKNLFS